MPDNETVSRRMPLLCLRGMSVFPGMLMTFDVERSASIAALKLAMSGDQLIFLSTQKDISVDVPTQDDIYSIGTVCRIRQQFRQTGSRLCRVMVEGLRRAYAIRMDFGDECNFADVVRLDDKPENVSPARKEALLRNCLNLFEEYVNEAPNLANEMLLNVVANPDASYVADYIAQNVHFGTDDKQKLLEERYVSKRLTMLGKMLNNELNIIAIENQLNDATQEQIERSQREYYLREELKVIRSELGEDDSTDDISQLRDKVSRLNAPKEAVDKLNKEINHLAKQPFGSSEAAVLRGYIDTCLELPWGKRTNDTVDIEKAKKVLDDEHFGLNKVKERIIEYLAVKQLSPEIKGGLICLVGPPGTGKTSIAMSVAHATNRNLVRISLGGIHDEAEIRGHRKTYIGSMPGRIMNGIIQAKSMNPVMVLDEIDKLGSDYRGDPSAALLEALDPEQNVSFRDHYLEIPFNLSEVFFIMTANTVDTIPRPLLDRMEVIELTSYTDEEKLQIAKRHLIPKQRRKHGINGRQLRLSDDAVREIISLYTRESGVRVLEREIAAICRKCAAKLASGEVKSVSIRAGGLSEYLGVAKYLPDALRRQDEVGLVRGLAYTEVGGEVLDVEVSVVDGTGKVELTGNLGDVMKESAKAAITYIRSRAKALGIDPDFHKNKDIHIHFPEGAVPKDGPSAGITMCIALISALTNTPVRRDIAMTGEITLRGRILPIGGLKEKTMAAMRAGVRTVIIPADNEPNLNEIDQTVRNALNFVVTDHVDKIIDIALVKKPGENIICPSPSGAKNRPEIVQ